MPGMTRALALFIALLWCAASALAEVRAVRGFARTVADAERSVAFYENALGFKKVSEQIISDRNFDELTGIFGTRVKIVTLRLGDETLELNQFLTPAGQPIPLDSRSNDLWFQHMAIVVSDMERAYRQVSRFNVQAISDAPQTIPASNTAAAGIQAYKFKDPDGHPLELLYFPPGKGAAKWHAAGERLFLGIDHSAFTIADTERSLAFYRDVLGLKVAGASLNSGATQEHLDNAFGAVVRITGLRPARDAGPGLEFLHYLTPAGGRAAAPEARVSDFTHTRSVLEVDDLPATLQKLEHANAAFISARIVRLAPYGQALMVKDPDGHALLLIQPN
ncbi:MAG: VOC family protein [Burkholderiales bacterium]